MLSPDNVAALNNLGTLHTDRKEFSQAGELLKRCIELWPDFADAHFSVGGVYVKERNAQSALVGFETPGRLNLSRS